MWTKSYTLLYCFGIFSFQRVILESTIEDSTQIFALNIFKDFVGRNLKQNVILSPYLVERQMMLAFIAASGQTSNEIKKALNITEVEPSDFFRFLQKKPEGFLSREKFYYNNKLRLLKSFKNLAEYFETELQAIEDDDDVEASETDINLGIIEMNTKIPLESNVTANMGTVIFENSISFQDQWNEPFNRVATRPATFRMTGNFPVSVNSMYSVRYVGYADLNNMEASAIQLPFQNSDTKMLILLPNKEVNQKKWLSKLSVPDIFEHLHNEITLISMPTFNIDFKLNMAEALAYLGFETLSNGDADFSNAFQNPHSTLIPYFFQKISFNINEFGSDVNITAEQQIMQEQSNEQKLNKSPDRFFIVDRPFIFMLHTNGIIHVIGRICCSLN